MGQKSVEKLLNAIEESKNNDLEKLIFGLGIRHCGSKVSKILADEFLSLERLMDVSVDEIRQIDAIGEVIASEIVKWFSDDNNRNIVLRLKELGLKTEHVKEEVKESYFTGKKVVLTGSLANFERSEAKKIIESLGGKTIDSVSKNTNIVLAGEKAGSKLDKAKALGIQIMTEEEFMELIKEF